MTKKRWMKVVERPRPAKHMDAEKTIIAACEAFVRDMLKQRFLPEIRPNEFNYAIDIFGEWGAAGRYRFMQRYRSDAPNRIKDKFEAPFARLDFAGPDRFDIYWMRHTCQWWPVHQGVTLDDALGL